MWLIEMYLHGLLFHTHPYPTTLAAGNRGAQLFLVQVDVPQQGQLLHDRTPVRDVQAGSTRRPDHTSLVDRQATAKGRFFSIDRSATLTLHQLLSILLVLPERVAVFRFTLHLPCLPCTLSAADCFLPLLSCLRAPSSLPSEGRPRFADRLQSVDSRRILAAETPAELPVPARLLSPSSPPTTRTTLMAV